MRVIIEPDYQALSQWAANYVASKINAANPTPEKPFVLGCPTGSSPLGMYKALIELNKQGKVSFQNVVTFNMDEYVGLPEDHPESYHTFMWKNFFNHIDIKKENVHILNGNAEDLEAECANYEKQIAEIGLVHAASFKQQPNVVFKLLAMNKRAPEPLYDFLFPLCQPVRISRVNCRKACIKKLISSALKLYSALFIINMFQKQSFLHAILRPLLNKLSLQLETYDGNGLVHLLYQITLHIICTTWSHLKHKSGACKPVCAEI